jgi:hypothetical protein
MLDRRGGDGQPLPSGEHVLRFAHKPKDFQQTQKPLPISIDIFLPSSAEKEDPPLRISVFAEALTSREQAWRIAGSKHDLVVRISVNEIRALREQCGNSEIDVVWHHIH